MICSMCSPYTASAASLGSLLVAAFALPVRRQRLRHVASASDQLVAQLGVGAAVVWRHLAIVKLLTVGLKVSVEEQREGLDLAIAVILLKGIIDPARDAPPRPAPPLRPPPSGVPPANPNPPGSPPPRPPSPFPHASYVLPPSPPRVRSSRFLYLPPRSPPPPQATGALLPPSAPTSLVSSTPRPLRARRVRLQSALLSRSSPPLPSLTRPYAAAPSPPPPPSRSPARASQPLVDATSTSSAQRPASPDARR